MIQVKKGNRFLTVNENEAAYYLSEGYDVVTFNEEAGMYDVVKPATGGKMYTVGEYNAIKNERDEALAELAKLKETKPAEDTMSERQKIVSELNARGIEFKKNASTDALKHLLEFAE